MGLRPFHSLTSVSHLLSLTSTRCVLVVHHFIPRDIHHGIYSIYLLPTYVRLCYLATDMYWAPTIFWWFPYCYLDCHLPPLMFVVLLVFVSCLQSSRFKFVYRCTTCTWRCDDVMQCRRFLVRAFAMYWQQCPNCARETTCLEWTIYWFDGLNRLMYGPEWFVDFVLTFW